LFLFRSASKVKVAKRLLFVEPHAVEERKLRVHAMSEHHVTEFVRQDGSQAGLVWKHVHQPAAQDDGVAYGERLQR